VSTPGATHSPLSTPHSPLSTPHPPLSTLHDPLPSGGARSTRRAADVALVAPRAHAHCASALLTLRLHAAGRAGPAQTFLGSVVIFLPAALSATMRSQRTLSYSSGSHEQGRDAPRHHRPGV